MASRSLGTLTVDLVAKVGGFTEGMSKADRETQKRMRAIRKSIDDTAASVKRFVAVGAAAGAAAAAVTVALVNNARQAIDTQAKLARTLGSTVEGLQVATRAGELSGVAFGQLEQFTKDLTRRLAQAADGTGPAVKALERLRLTAEELQALPLDQRIALIRARLDEFVPVAQRAAVAGQLFGEEGSLNALRFTAENIERARREIDLFGAALSDIDAAQVEAANDAISSLSIFREGIGQRLTVELAPFLTAAADGLQRIAEQAGGLDVVVADIFDRLVVGSATAVAAVRGPLDTIRRVIESLWNGFNALPTWVKEVGVVGAIVGGRKGRVLLAGLAFFGEEIDDLVGQMRAELAFAEKQAEDGVGFFRRWFPKKEDFEAFKAEYLAELEQANDNGPSIFGAVLGSPDQDSQEWLDQFLAGYERIKAASRAVAEQAINTPAPPGPALPSVPGADANMPGQDPAIVAARAIEGWLDAGEKVKEETDKMSAYADQAARNMQTAFADFLFDPFDAGLKGMLQSFADTLQRLAAEAAASAIFDKIFGSLGQGGGLGGFLGDLLGGASGRAMGGPVMAGVPYQVGEMNRPELLIYGNRQYLIPGDNGRVEPMGGGMNQVFNITTPNADSFRASERQILRRARRGLIA